jgi:hypothetical protein
VVCAKEESFLKSRNREDLDHLIVGTHVHRSRVVQKSDYPEELECDCGSVQASQSSEAQTNLNRRRKEPRVNRSQSSEIWYPRGMEV